MIKIRVFRAIDDIESCQKYLEGHVRVLKIFGITMITSANIEWFYDPNTYVIIAESEDGVKVYGGARIQIANSTFPLPIETAVEEFDSSIHELVNRLAENGGTGELCGLWNSREVAGYGLGSIYLGRVGVAIAKFLNLNSLFALCAPSTVKNCMQVGFKVETSLGNEGLFYYPKEDLLATAVILKDVVQLSSADPFERECIFDLRLNPRQTTIQDSAKGEMKIEFDLVIPHK
ncbi:hypothetical protein [uncultured Cytophaga sp.]|uniref:hypothetical protein n=1 Tax=uncultured Cytophaga sp. TaxID=160238 RepID=UPI002615B143|nr:hypothetical protein [uncultured Cytophaga sp.]